MVLKIREPIGCWDLPSMSAYLMRSNPIAQRDDIEVERDFLGSLHLALKYKAITKQFPRSPFERKLKSQRPVRFLLGCQSLETG